MLRTEHISDLNAISMKMQFDIQEPLVVSDDCNSETWRQGVKAFFNRRFTFRLWHILVFLLIIAVIIIVGACILSTRHGPGKLQGMKICSKAAMTKQTKENGGNALSD